MYCQRIIQYLRFFLFPFSCLLYVYLELRRFLYWRGFLKVHSFSKPIISVGNLRVGGTGKTPFIEFLLKRLGSKYLFALVSRGYKRKRSGLIFIYDEMGPSEVGDEAYLLHSKYRGVKHFVAEDRVQAIRAIEHHFPETEVVILDDTYHHLNIRFSKNILLMDYYHSRGDDFLLPVGNLREPKGAYRRADIIVVTKCPLNLSLNEALALQGRIKIKAHQFIFYSGLEYGSLKHLFKNEFLEVSSGFKQEIILVHGIAQPVYLLEYLNKRFTIVHNLEFVDHKDYGEKEVLGLVSLCERHKNAIVVTTEKDGIKLVVFKKQIQFLPIYVLPIEVRILFNQEGMLLEKLGL